MLHILLHYKFRWVSYRKEALGPRNSRSPSTIKVARILPEGGDRNRSGRSDPEAARLAPGEGNRGTGDNQRTDQRGDQMKTGTQGRHSSAAVRPRHWRSRQ